MRCRVGVLFYLYGPAHTAVESPYLNLAERGDEAAEALVHGLHGRMSMIWAVATVLATLSVCFFWRAPSARWLGAFNVVAGIVMALAVARLALAAFDRREPAAPSDASGSDGAAPTSVLGYNPDIYYIILGGYARADLLRERYGFDNSPFIDRNQPARSAAPARKSAAWAWEGAKRERILAGRDRIKVKSSPDRGVPST